MRTQSGQALTDLFLASFPFHGALMAAGERLTADVGLTSARWQVLSAIARADRPEPVANIARNMGLTRQAVQRVATDLEKLGMIRFGPNPHHKRAFLMHITEMGGGAFDAISKKQAPWVNALANDIDRKDLVATFRTLRKLTEKLSLKMGE